MIKRKKVLKCGDGMTQSTKQNPCHFEEKRANSLEVSQAWFIDDLSIFARFGNNLVSTSLKKEW